MPPDAAGRPSVHLGIDVPDLEAGLAFYGGVFGFAEISRPLKHLAVLDAGNLTVCLHARAEGSRPAPGLDDPRRYARHWTPVHADVHVADLDATLALVARHGGTVEAVFRSGGPRPVAFCAYPFGNGFCVLGPPAAS